MTAASRPASAPGPPPPHSAAPQHAARPARGRLGRSSGTAVRLRGGRGREQRREGGGQRRYSRGLTRTALRGLGALTSNSRGVRRAKGSASCSLSHGHVLFTQHERSSQTAPSPTLGYRSGSSQVEGRFQAEVISLKQFSTPSIHKVD